jgi:protein required for attachment to host cells
VQRAVEKFPNLKTERVFVDDNPPAHGQGTDRPGRSFKRAGTNQRGGVETADWHESEKHRFAKRAAAAAEELMRAHRIKALAVVAALACRMTACVDPDMQRLVIEKIEKGPDQHSVFEIERHLVG